MGFHGAKIILWCGDAMLVLLRDDRADIPWPGHWDVPGGGREDGETAESCALREAFEETGLRLSKERISWGGSYPSVVEKGGESWMFAAEISADEAADARLGAEGQALEMMAIEAYLSHPKAVPHLADRVREWRDETSRKTRVE